MTIKYTTNAKEDFQYSLEYYKNESITLANNFKADIKASINRIKSFPHLYPTAEFNSKIQKCIVSKFPFTLYYTILNDTIFILAVANHYKNPKYFEERF